jgi:hypothetical protein
MSSNPFIDLLILYLTTPSSDFYLSKLIGGSKNPTLEPFTAAEVSLGTQTIAGISMALSLQNLIIQGISNVQVQKNNGVPVITVNGNNVSFAAQTPNTEAPPPNVPGALTLTALLNIVPSSTPPFSGYLTVTINQSTLLGNFTATSNDGTPQQVVVNFSQLTFNAAAAPSNMTVTLVMSNPLAPFINSILNQPAVLQKIISGVQGELSQANVLQALSQFATQAARTVLSE